MGSGAFLNKVLKFLIIYKNFILFFLEAKNKFINFQKFFFLPKKDFENSK